MSAPVYELGEVLHVGSVHALRRAIDRRDGSRVVLKCLDADHRSEGEAHRLRREYAILRDLDLPGVVQAKELREDDGELRLVLVDAGGTNLTSHIQKRGRPPLRESLDLVIQLADTLGQLHAHGVIHKDIKPRNILVDGTGKIQIIDFGIAARVTREAPSIQALRGIQGTLAYISPEQTGRTGRGVDHRTDLYSLGATFYELLVGHPPFTSNDPAELIHAHIARLPTPPHILDPALPPLLSAIVLRLLAKAPEERYRSAFGLANDLRRARDELAAGRSPDFPLGEHDPPLLFQIPDTLYGREAEAKLLEAAVQRVREGGAELVLIRGPAGAGKSSLARSLRHAALEGRVVLAAGKYDPQRSDVPYAAIREAFGALLAALALEGPQATVRWRWTLERALGAAADALLPLLPELAELLERRPDAGAQLSPDAARNRLHRAMYTLVRAVARPGAPLVLHLDDLHSADPASIDLLVALLGEMGGEGFCCVGTCRSEGEDSPALQAGLRQLAGWCRVTSIALGPLPPAAIARMVADTLALPVDRALPLADVIAAKTHGAPAFAAELLRALHGAGVVRFDTAASAWTYDLAAAAAFSVTDNVVDLLLARLHALPEPARRALQRGACVGDAFRADDLRLDDDPEVFAAALDAAAAAGLVEGIGDRLRFAHNRIREAVDATLTPPERLTIHLALARAARGRLGPDAATDDLLAVVDHYNRAIALVDDPAERVAVAELDLKAAERASDAAAFAAAASLCRRGLEFLGEGGWSTHPRLAFRLALLGCKSEFTGGDLATAEAWNADLLARIRDPEDRAEVLLNRANIHLARGELDTVVARAAEMVALVGGDLPRKVSTPGMIAAIIRAQRMIGRRRPEDLLALPPLTERRHVLLLSGYAVATGAAFQADLKLLTVLAVKMTTVTLQHGLAGLAATPLVVQGIVAGAPRRDFALMDAYGRTALAVLERYPDPPALPIVRFLYGGMIQPMMHPYRECIAGLRAAIRQGLDVGADQGAGYCWMTLVSQSINAGVNLEELRAESASALDLMKKAKVGPVAWNSRIDRGYILTLLGESRGPGDLSCDAFDEAEFLAQIRSEVAPVTRYVFLSRSLEANLILGRHDVTRQRIREADPGVADAFRFFDTFFNYRAYRAVALAAAAPEPLGWLARRALARELKSTLHDLTLAARSSPANFAPLRMLIAAELARVDDELRAPAAYEAAIASAREHGVLHIEALACERAARHLLARGAREAAQAYLVRARRTYLRWGARAKVALLDQEFAALRVERPLLAPAASIADVSITLTAEPSSASSGASSASSGGDHVVDIASVVKAAQVFAAEIDLGALAGRLMRIVVENAGAERGVLLLQQGAALCCVAEYSTRTDQVQDLGEAPIDALGTIPVAFVTRALRAGRALAIHDAAADPTTLDDPYVRRRRLRSILVAPLIVQGRTVGAIYLENNLATGVFTAQRLDILQILAVQAAIAVEHAGFFRRLDAARRAAEAASLAKSNFLANMSHELRTPLNAILGYAEIIQEDVEAAGLDGIAADLSRIREAGDHLLGIIGEILDLTKVESGTLEIERSVLVVEALLDEVVDLAGAEIERTGNRLARDQAPDLGVIVGDRIKIRQILLNLLGNAAKFTERGVITLRARRDGDRLVFEVEDTGIGMSEAQMATIFEPFTQADSSSTRRYGGVGLGLTICKRLTEQMGGTLTVRSAIGVGSTFRVVLPTGATSTPA